MDTKEIQKLISVDPLLWAHTKGLKTKSGLSYSIKSHAYQIGLLQKAKRITNIKKGTQIGITLVMQIDAIHGLIYKRYPQGVLYMMPSEKHVERFSKLRFTPMFDENRWLKKYLLVNNVNEKVINGGSLIFVGARSQTVGNTSIKDSPHLRTFECDRIVRDEVDHHDKVLVEQSKQRLNYSLIRQEVNLGSPTSPDYGIDRFYEGSDQGLWQIKCRECGRHTCLEKQWESSIIKRDGEWLRTCVHCNNEIFAIDGEWIAEYPDREEYGMWVSGFLSPRADLEIYMKRLLESEGSKKCEALRSIVGEAAIDTEYQLDSVTVQSRCTKDPCQMVSTGETVMGVDIGKKIHVVVGIRIAREAYDILSVSCLDNLTELHDIALKMNVHNAVIDSGPYDHGVREFQRTEPYAIHLCQYSEGMPGKPKFDSKAGMVRVNRNEWMDKVHATYVGNNIKIPRRSVMIDEYISQMTHTAKENIIHPDTGQTKPRWLKRGADHFYHATLYFLLAAYRTSPRLRSQMKVIRPSHSINNWK